MTDTVQVPDTRHIIIFDGVCNFCCGGVNFVIRRDPQEKFAFVPMQSELGQSLIRRHGKSGLGDATFFLIRNGACLVRSDAVLEVLRELGGGWPMLRILRFAPRPVRDFLYQAFADNRYRLAGRRAACLVPDQAIRGRFLGVRDGTQQRGPG